MEYVTYQHAPELRNALVIAAFTGWPDAGDVASATVRHLIRHLDAQKFAEIDPESFFDFTQVRPQTVITEGTQRSIVWPVGEFYVVPAQPDGRDLVLFIGPEPHLQWKTYTETMMAVLRQCNMAQLVTLGGTYDSVPHTGAAVISAIASDDALARRFDDVGVGASDYEGPASIHSSLVAACMSEDTPTLSLWGHAPHYVQAVPNWKVTYALLDRLSRFFGVQVDVDELKAAGATMERRVERALARDPELQAYVRQLQERHEVVTTAEPDPLTTEDVFLELEQILRPTAVAEADDEDDDDEPYVGFSDFDDFEDDDEEDEDDEDLSGGLEPDRR